MSNDNIIEKVWKEIDWEGVSAKKFTSSNVKKFASYVLEAYRQEKIKATYDLEKEIGSFNLNCGLTLARVRLEILGDAKA